jgi:hypothetical protein
MSVKTASVTGRRTVRYGSYDDLLADAEQLAAQPVQTIGNWSQAQIYKHLEMSVHSSIDGPGFALPAPVRWLMSLLMKRRFLTRAIPAGFQAPQRFVPSDQTGLVEALSELRQAIERVKSEKQRGLHPAFGRMTREEWDLFNLRHAELHMSFLAPAAE